MARSRYGGRIYGRRSRLRRLNADVAKDVGSPVGRNQRVICDSGRLCQCWSLRARCWRAASSVYWKLLVQVVVVVW